MTNKPIPPPCPALKTDRGEDLSMRQRAERANVWELIHILANEGWMLAKVDGDPETDPEEAMETIFNLDEVRVVFRHLAHARGEVVFLVLGNSACEVVCDYSNGTQDFTCVVERVSMAWPEDR